MAYASAASTAGIAANAYAVMTCGPIPGTLRWIMNGMMLIAAPIMEQMPVAVRPRRPSWRLRPVCVWVMGRGGRGPSAAGNITRTAAVGEVACVNPVQ